MESKDPCRVSDAGHPFRVPLLDTRRIPAVRKCRALCRVGILRLRECRACAATHFAQDDRRAKTSDAICGTLTTERWVTSRRLAVCFRVYGDVDAAGEWRRLAVHYRRMNPCSHKILVSTNKNPHVWQERPEAGDPRILPGTEDSHTTKTALCGPPAHTTQTALCRQSTSHGGI